MRSFFPQKASGTGSSKMANASIEISIYASRMPIFLIHGVKANMMITDMILRTNAMETMASPII